MPIDATPGSDEALDRAAALAIELRATVGDLPDTALRELADLVLIELGRQIAQRQERDTSNDDSAAAG